VALGVAAAVCRVAALGWPLERDAIAGAVALLVGFAAGVVGFAAGAAMGRAADFTGCDGAAATRLVVVVVRLVVGASANATPDDRAALVGCALANSSF